MIISYVTMKNTPLHRARFGYRVVCPNYLIVIFFVSIKTQIYSKRIVFVCLFILQRTSGASPNSPSKQVPASAEVEMDLICSSDGLTPVSIY